MARWTRFIIRNRKKVLLTWLVVFLLGGAASSGLADLLTNRFSVPGSDAERGLDLLKEHFGERGDGGFTLVVRPTAGREVDPALIRQTARAARRAAGAVEGGRAGVPRPAGRGPP